MGHPGKAYSKKKLDALIDHYGSIKEVAKACQLAASTMWRVQRGGGIHSPTRSILDAHYKVITKAPTEKMGFGALLNKLTVPAETSLERDTLARMEGKINEINRKLDLLMHAWGVEG